MHASDIAWEEEKRCKSAFFGPDSLFHVTDWLPTLYHAAGGGALSAQTDGIDQWWSLSMNEPAARTEMLYNLNPVFVFQRPVNGAIRLVSLFFVGGGGEGGR